MRAPLHRFGLMVACLIALAGCAAPTPAAPTVPPTPPAPTAATSPTASSALQPIIDGAKQEGTLNLVYSAGIGDDQEVQQWADGMNKLYGTNLTVHYSPGDQMPQMAGRIVQEYQAGRPASSDVFFGTETHVITLMQSEALDKQDWSWAPNLQNAALLAPDGVVVEIATRIPGITYNTDRLKGDAIPKTLDDLLKPQYKGKIATTPYAAGFLLLVDPTLWGSQKVIDYMTKLSSQVAGLINCGEGQRVASGEFDLYGMDCGESEAIRLKSRGAHVDYVIPTDAPFIAYNYLMVPKNSAHPNAAKLWINYMLGSEAQTIMYEHEFVDHHLVPGSKVAADVAKLKASGATLIEDDVNFALRQDQKEVNRVRTEVQGILQKGVGH